MFNHIIYKALSCFKWLELKIIETKKSDIQENLNDFDYEDTRHSLNKEQSQSEKILLNFTDKNLILHDGDEINKKQDKDLRDSLMVLTYLNMSICYMREANFKEAIECIEDALKLNERNSLIYFRRSQALACNLCANLKKLSDAKLNIEKAIYLNQFEEKNEQKIYVELAHYIENRIKFQKDKLKKALNGVSFILL